MEYGLLYDSYVCNKNLHQYNINTWFSSIEFIPKKHGVNIPIKTCRIYKFIKVIKYILHSQYILLWNA